MEWLLTDEQIFQAQKYTAGTSTFNRVGRNVAKVQARKLVEGLEEIGIWEQISNKEQIMWCIPEEEWQALRKAVGLS